jgi:hypothetical protein
VRSATERWFLKRGLPHFIAEYRAATDIWTRATPALTLIFLVEIGGLAPSDEFPLWISVALSVAAFAVVLGGWAVVNRRRGRPLLQRPDDLGPFELTAFVVVPAIVAQLAGGQTRQAIGVLIANVVLLAVIYFTASYGLVSMARWGLGVLARQLGTVVLLLARALPLIALLVTFLFLTEEVWQTVGSIEGAMYWVAFLLFPIVGVLFLMSQLPRDVGTLNDFRGVTESSGDDFGALCADTPIASVAHPPPDGRPPALSRREWLNVALVSLVSQGVQILLVSVLIGAFFVLLGVLLVDEKTTLTWARDVNVLLEFSAGNRQCVVTEQLLRVAGFLMAFSGLNFTVYLATDETYRREFRAEVLLDLRQAFAVRAAYLGYLAGTSSIIPPT